MKQGIVHSNVAARNIVHRQIFVKKMVWPVKLAVACMPRCESLFSKTIIGVRKECRLKANSAVELLVLCFSIYVHLHNQLSQCIQRVAALLASGRSVSPVGRSRER